MTARTPKKIVGEARLTPQSHDTGPSRDEKKPANQPVSPRFAFIPGDVVSMLGY